MASAGGTPSALPGHSRFDPDEIRRIVQLGRDRGLVRGGGAGVAPIEKNGQPLSADGKFRSQWMDITPAMATRWLENNLRNRLVRDDVVHAYARDMTNGVWVPTHQGLAFNDRDELIDGQHRLLAIVLSGKTIRMMVTFGLPSQIDGAEMTTMDAVDRGRTRSVADQLKIQHGMTNGSIIAALCMSLAGICSGERTRRLSVGQTLDILRAFQVPVDWVIIHRPKEHGLRQTGVLAAFTFALATEESMEADIGSMLDGLMTGKGLKERSPIKHLRTFLTSDEAKLLARGTDRGIAELTLQAIYLQLKARPIERLDMATDGVKYFRAKQGDRVEKIATMFRLPGLPANKEKKL